MLQPWFGHVLGGGVLALGFLTLFAFELAELRLRGDAPAPMTVDGAVAYFADGGTRLAHVRLIDAEVDCADLVFTRGRVYAPARGPDASRSPVLIELDRSVDCDLVEAAPVGDIRAGGPALWSGARYYLGGEVSWQTPVMRLHRPPRWAPLLFFAALAIGGLWLVVHGLRLRRENIALLRRVMAQPVAPDPAAPGPGGAYRRVEPQQHLLSRPMRASPRWLVRGRVRTLLVVGLAAIGVIVTAAWLVSLLRASSPTTRWLTPGLWTALALLGAHAARKHVRDSRRARRRLDDILRSGPEEILLKIVANRQSGPDSALSIYRLRTPEGVEFEETFLPGELPFFLEPFGPEVLAIRSAGAPEVIIVLRDDLSPLLADADEGARVRGRHRALMGIIRLPVMPPRRRKRRV